MHNCPSGPQHPAAQTLRPSERGTEARAVRAAAPLGLARPLVLLLGVSAASAEPGKTDGDPGVLAPGPPASRRTLCRSLDSPGRWQRQPNLPWVRPQGSHLSSTHVHRWPTGDGWKGDRVGWGHVSRVSRAGHSFLGRGDWRQVGAPRGPERGLGWRLCKASASRVPRVLTKLWRLCGEVGVFGR